MAEGELEGIVRKMQRKGKIAGILVCCAMTGVTAAMGASYVNANQQGNGPGAMFENVVDAVEEEADKNRLTIKADEKKQAIEDLVKEIRTPEEAFAMINSEIEFCSDHDERVNMRRDYWASLQETWERKTGDCDDGAIAFKALLSDNPEYKVNIVLLKQRIEPGKKKDSHFIAVYKDDTGFGLWGYVSFNNLHSNGSMENPVFGSMERAISEYNSNGEYVSYAVIDFTDEELKFGTDLTRLVDYLPTIPIMEIPETLETPLSVEGYI